MSCEEFGFEFELLNSNDGKTITLVCVVDREVTPDEYAVALIAFAERINSLLSMSEASNGTMN